MSGSLACSPEGETGFRLEQLAAAFDRVRNPRDWKAPIEAVIPDDDRPIVEQAVRWFTGTEAKFRPHGGDPGRLLVVALGYRLGQVDDGPSPLTSSHRSRRWLAPSERDSGLLSAAPDAGGSR